MKFEQQLIFLFSALGGLNGILLSSYFLFKGKRLSDYFLSGLLLMLSIRVTKSSFLYFNPTLLEFFVQFGIAACMLIGPFLLLYTRQVIGQKTSSRFHWLWHVIPFLVIVLVFSYQHPYYGHRGLWNTFIEMVYKQWLIYMLISGYFLIPIFRKILHKVKLQDHEYWIMNVFVGTFIVWLAYETSSYTSYIVGALSFTFLFYTTLLLGFFRRSNKQIAVDEPVKYRNSSLTDPDIEKHAGRLSKIMSEEKPYLDMELTLSKLGEKLGVTGKELSQIINQSQQQNFSQYIAALRVKEAKGLLQSKTHQHLKIAAIAHESGFNSISAFNHHFKNLVGITAKDYRDKLDQKIRLPES